MSEPGRGRARGRAGRGDNLGPGPRRPGTQQQQQPGPSAPRPQPPSAWGPPSVAPPVRASVPGPSALAGRAMHRTTPSSHEHPGDVNIQARMKELDIGGMYLYNILISWCTNLVS